ncbi:hypothetical protein MLD38_036547 [Melastoma candidum]|uniref:Uncharacterized protein n=1 Tax=Melastoma candidum TaxID=119954 RepID=A0ACB9LKL0_9MYRT|nr:hypothetical protein MLD38_036547 [Melastoma candidum]
MNPSTSSASLLTLALVLALAVAARAQSTPAVATCASKLTPCALYLNGTTTPSAECCSSIKDAVANDRACLCKLYTTPGLLASLGVNVTQALKLTQQCGASTDTSICSSLASAPGGSTTPATPAAVPGNDATKKAAWTWMVPAFAAAVLASSLIH